MALKTRVQKYWRRLKSLLIEYSEHSTIHGVSYIVEQNRSWFERAWWIAAFSALVLCCGKLIFDAWHINPIIISFTGKPTPIWQVSVSSCNS